MKRLEGVGTLLLGVAFVIASSGVVGMFLYEIRDDISLYHSQVVFPEAPLSTSPVDVQKTLDLINEARQKKNLPPFTKNKDLSFVAYIRTLDILGNSDFTHEATLSGATTQNILGKLRFRYSRLMENLVLNQRSADLVVESWTKSPKHADVLFAKGKWNAGIYSLQGKFFQYPAIVTVLIVAQ